MPQVFAARWGNFFAYKRKKGAEYPGKWGAQRLFARIPRGCIRLSKLAAAQRVVQNRGPQPIL